MAVPWVHPSTSISPTFGKWLSHTLWCYPEPHQSQCLIFHRAYNFNSDDPKLPSKFLKTHISNRFYMMQLTDIRKLHFIYITYYVLSFLEFKSLTEIQVLQSLNQNIVNSINIRCPIITWGEKAVTWKWHFLLWARLVRNKPDLHCPMW